MTMKRVLGVLAGLILGGGLLGAASLTLRERAVVSDGLVRLRDVAEISSALPAQVGGLVIAVAPDLGASQVIGRREIVDKLVGNGIVAPEIAGAAAVRVERRGKVVDPSFFQDEIHRYVAEHSPWGADVRVQVLSTRSLVVPEGGVQWQIVPAGGQDFLGNVLFQVKAYANNEEILGSWITARVRVERLVAVSNRPIAKNEAFGADAVRWEKREITPFIRNAVLDQAQLLGRRSGRLIAANTIITDELLQADWLVRRGENAVLAVSFKNIKATSAVTVMADGRLGDTVRVMSGTSKKILTARVVGKGQVETEVQQ